MKIFAETPTSKVVVTLCGVITQDRIEKETMIAHWRAKMLS